MARLYKKQIFCSKCGHSGMSPSEKVCPHCGKNIARTGGIFSSRWAILALMSVLAPAMGVVYFYLFQPRVAVEISRLISPQPTHFLVGIDVSASIDQDVLDKTKDAMIGRLMHFIGNDSIFYQISSFGNRGCGRQSISRLVALSSPENYAAFDAGVQQKLASVAAAPIAPRDLTPLTTPFYCFLETILEKSTGNRIIIFSDMLNDDGDCREPFIFPTDAVERFGAEKSNEIFFLYTSPEKGCAPAVARRLIDDQKEFIDRMNGLADAGKIRVFFHPIPDDPLKSHETIRKTMRLALPSTIGDGIEDRLSRILYAISAVLFG